jgi:hypothetical protein
MILSGFYDEPQHNAEEDLIQDQTSLSLVTRLGKNLLNPMNTLRNLQRSIFRSRKSFKTKMTSESQKSQLIDKRDPTLKVYIDIQSTEEAIEIFDKSILW